VWVARFRPVAGGAVRVVHLDGLTGRGMGF